MNEEELEDTQEPIQHPIPQELYPFESDEPFKECKLCGSDLLEPGMSYVIERNIRTKTNDVIFEHAICMPCMDQIGAKMSEESKKNLQEYMFSKMDPFEYLIQRRSKEMLFDLKHCKFSGEPVDEMDEYQMVALCNGPHLNPQMPPYVLSTEITEEMQELLSAETKEELDDFIENNFGLPPEWKELFKNRPIMV